MVLCLIVIIEPEKLRYPSYFGVLVLVLCLLSFWYKNGITYKQLENKPKIPLFLFSGLDNFIGNQLYALEAIGTLFTVRSTLKKRKNMQFVLHFSFVLIFCLLIINGMSFIMTYETD